MVGIAVSVALGITLYRSISEPIYRPLDYQISQKNMASIADTLEKARISYKIDDRNGLILVPANDIEMARLKLNAAGIPKDDGFNYSFLNEQNALTNSQFIENARYLRALENEISKTISSIEGVSGARVHIAVPRNNVFADENNKVTASVVLNISPGFSSNKEKIRSIIQIVADSVPGLDPKDIAITDQYGHFLSDGMDQNSIYSAAQLNYQNNIQNYYEKRIESMIVPLLGANKVIVRVNADIDFTQHEQAQEEYDPNKTVLISEQSNIEQNETSGASGPPGSLSNSPPEEGSKNTPQSQATGGQKRSQSTKNYNASKYVSYKRMNVAQIKNISVAVVVDNEIILDPKTKKYISKPVAQDKITKITELVKAVIGYDEKRGDKVTVVNSVYSQVKEEIPNVQVQVWEMPWFWDVAKKIIGIILGFAFLFIIYRKLSNYAATINQAKQKSVFVADEESNDENSVNRMHKLKKDGIDQLKQLAANEPNKVALIIKGWVRK
ncbi:flagellar basal-body MS-ring/collar protein FliF [Aquicella lusitana]|nr:flagellar basal-body MS-ring/collar protein FliF [Aquicella lusitana]